MKRYQIENVVPLVFSLLTLWLMILKFSLSLFYVFGILFSVVGLIIWWFGKIALGDAFSAMPQANRIVKNGIYLKLRHPIYYGLSLMLVGWMFLFGNWIAYVVCGLTVIIQFIRSRLEERVLEKKFGTLYLEYKKKTLF